MKLNADDREDLENVLQSVGWKVLLRIAEELTSDIEKRVLQYNLEDGLERLGHAKARAEGARKLMHSIQQLQKVYLENNKG